LIGEFNRKALRLRKETQSSCNEKVTAKAKRTERFTAKALRTLNALSGIFLEKKPLFPLRTLRTLRLIRLFTILHFFKLFFRNNCFF